MKRKRIAISPYSKPRSDGRPNAKNYPWWTEVLTCLAPEYDLIQIVHGQEPQLEIDIESLISHAAFHGSPLPRIEHAIGLRLPAIEELVRSCDAFMCVDNYLQHLGQWCGKRGVVLYGPSDPALFGYKENLNLYAGRKYFRPFQFQTWQEWEFTPDAFVKPEQVVIETRKFIDKL